MDAPVEAIADEAIGALTAQAIIEKMHAGHATVDHAWLAFVELSADRGWKSTACRAFVAELAKRAAPQAR